MFSVSFALSPEMQPKTVHVAGNGEDCGVRGEAGEVRELHWGSTHVVSWLHPYHQFKTRLAHQLERYRRPATVW